MIILEITILRKTEYQVMDYLEPIFGADATWSSRFKTLGRQHV
jgi:hypothetical protein